MSMHEPETIAIPREGRYKVFVSYCHHDKAMLERLQVHLQPLEREGIVEWWDDTRICPGQRWQQEIRSAIDRAKVAVLLLSPDFRASDFIAEEELPPLLRAAENEGLAILCVNLSHCREHPTLSEFQHLNPPSQPLGALSKVDQDAVWARLVREIEAAIAPHIALFELLSNRLSGKDVRILCIDLKEDYDDLEGDTKPDKLRGLISRYWAKKRLNALLHHVRRRHPDLAGELPHPEHEANRAHTYLDIATLEFLPPPGLAHILRNPAKMYLSLACAETPGGPGEDALSFAHEQLGRHRSLLVVGDYGTGKSFLVQRIFLDQSERYRTQGGRLPVLLPLKELHGMAEDRVITRISKQLREFQFFDLAGLSLAEEKDVVEHKLSAGELLCILDGFDEIPLLAIRPDPMEELQKLLRQLSRGDNKVIVTTRSGIIPSVLKSNFAGRIPGLGLAYLLPWDPPEKHWRAYIAQCRRCGIVFEGAAEDYEQIVLQRPELRQLTVTPLYCQMLVETREKVVQTPDLNVAKLYNIYTEQYFDNVRERSLLRDQFKDPEEEFRFKHDCLSATAVCMLDKSSLRLSKDNISESLYSNAHIYDMTQLAAFVRSETLVYSLLIPDSSDTWSFSHKSFYEYYVARKLLAELELLRDRNNLLNTLLMPKEVLTFLAGLLTKDHSFTDKLEEMFSASRELLQVLGIPLRRPVLLRNLALLHLERGGTLAGADLSGLQFSGYQFGSGEGPANLLRVSLDSCEMEGVSMVSASLRECSMRSTKLNQGVLDGADVRNVDFTGAYLNGISCDRTRFQGARFELAKLRRSDVDGIKAAIFLELQRYPGETDRDWAEKTLHVLDENQA